MDIPEANVVGQDENDVGFLSRRFFVSRVGGQARDTQ
jgi:hypothetical protein